MAKLFLGIMFFSVEAFGGEIANTKTGERITAFCTTEAGSPGCREFSIRHHRDGGEEIISSLVVRSMDDPEDQFLLREQVEKLKFFPLSDAVWSDKNMESSALATTGFLVGGLLIGCFGYSLESPAGYRIANAGGGMLMGGFAVFIVPAAIDVVSFPFRAFIKHLRFKKAGRDERAALRRLPVLMGDDAGVVRVGDREFKSLLKTLRTINNQAQDGNGQGAGIHTDEGSS